MDRTTDRLSQVRSLNDEALTELDQGAWIARGLPCNSVLPSQLTEACDVLYDLLGPSVTDSVRQLLTGSILSFCFVIRCL